jgi:hypothetical protein
MKIFIDILPGRPMYYDTVRFSYYYEDGSEICDLPQAVWKKAAMIVWRAQGIKPPEEIVVSVPEDVLKRLYNAISRRF